MTIDRNEYDRWRTASDEPPVDLEDISIEDRIAFVKKALQAEIQIDQNFWDQGERDLAEVINRKTGKTFRDVKDSDTTKAMIQFNKGRIGGMQMVLRLLEEQGL
jgi:hypothetical protein